MLPRNLKYQNKVEASSARAYTSNISPQNGTGPYYLGNTVIINIPTGRNTVLVGSESYLKFNLFTSSGAAVTRYIRMDGAGSSGIIQRMRVYHGSTLLEDTDNYHVLMAKLYSLQASADLQQGKLSILAGLAAYGNANVTTGEVYNFSVGQRLNVFGASLAASTAVDTGYCCIPLLSAVVGTLSSQYTPLFAMTGSAIRVELQLVDNILKAICSDTALSTSSTAHYITDVEFIASFIELSDSAIQTITESQMGQPLQYVVPQYRNYIDTKALANSITSVTCNVPAKYSSLKSLFCVMRNKADGEIKFFSQGSTDFTIADYRLRIGSEMYPNKAPASHAEFFAELLKAMGSVSDIDLAPACSFQTYTNDDISVANDETEIKVGAETKCANFMLGFDCETYSGADKSQIFSGMNTINSDVYWQLTFKANATAPNVRFDFYAMFDAVLICENGNMSVKW